MSVPTFPLLSRSQWEADEAHPDCTLCHATFTLFVRIHHCRSCGTLVCSECSQHRLKPVRRPNDSPLTDDLPLQRVCNACYQYHKDAHTTKRRPSDSVNVAPLTSASPIKVQSLTVQPHKPVAAGGIDKQLHHSLNRQLFIVMMSAWSVCTMMAALWLTACVPSASHAGHQLPSNRLMALYCWSGSILNVTILTAVSLTQFLVVTLLILPDANRIMCLSYLEALLYTARNDNQPIEVAAPAQQSINNQPTVSQSAATSATSATATAQSNVPAIPVRPGYKPANNASAVEQLQQYTASVMTTAYRLSTTSDGWTLRGEKTSVRLYGQPSSKPIPHTMFKAVILVPNISTKQAFDYLHDNNNDSQWNENLAEMYVLQTIPAPTSTDLSPVDITYSATKTIAGVVSSRDFLCVCANRQLADGSWQIASASTDAVKYANPKSSSVRGTNGPSGFLLQPAADGVQGTQLIVTLDTVLNGWISQSMCDNLADDVIIALLVKIRDCMTKHYTNAATAVS